MNRRHNNRKAVTYYGGGPLVDHEGYAVEVGVEDGANLMQLRIALDNTAVSGIRADLTPAAVAELRDRCDAFLNDHQEKS